MIATKQRKRGGKVGHTSEKVYISVNFNKEDSEKLKETAKNKCYSVSGYIRFAVLQTLRSESEK